MSWITRCMRIITDSSCGVRESVSSGNGFRVASYSFFGCCPSFCKASVSTSGASQQPPSAPTETASPSVRRDTVPPVGTVPDERHPHWPVCRESCQTRRHGWQDGQHGPTRAGPRCLEKRQATLDAVKSCRGNGRSSGLPTGWRFPFQTC